MNRKAVNSIIQEINYDVWRKSPWCYVKLQSLLEIAVDKYLWSIFSLTDVQSLKHKLDIVSGRLSQNLGIIYELNKKANDMKHNSDKDVRYEFDFLKNYFTEYNGLIKSTLPNMTDLFLDESIFNPQSTIFDHEQQIVKTDEKAGPNSQKKLTKFIYINSGVGRQDYGFKVYCLESGNELSDFQKSIYATIFNFLQRSNVAKKNLFIERYEGEAGHNVDFYKVFRYQLLILTLLRCGNNSNNTLVLNAVKSEQESIHVACLNINHYVDMLSQLCGRQSPLIEIAFSDSGIKVSLEKRTDCYIENIGNRENNTRDFWLSPSLLYSISIEKHEGILREFLHDFFDYKDFRPGQLEAIANSLNTKNRSICIMPTGAGKSIVFYMNALLSACPTIVISPTSVLAKDQQRNLKELHNIDDCAIYADNIEEILGLNNKLIYVTPEDLQKHKLILRIIHFNTSGMIANVILDEIHTLCNWSHDFRPDYLMLCNNLFTFVDRCRYLGFTATANYKVLTDLIRQFKIEPQNVIQPISFNAGNFEFDYIQCKDDTNQILALLKTIEQFINHRKHQEDKMIVFTHNVDESKTISQALAKLENYDTNCFDEEHTYSYKEFTTGVKHVLIADSEMGIGINLPNVVCTVHYGLPNSKAQYVQEIGRANRRLNYGKSIVIFRDTNNLNDEEHKLISFETSIDEIINIIKLIDTDLSRVFSSILGSTENYSASSSQIISIYKQIKDVENYEVITFRKNNSQSKKYIQKYLYKLHLLGVIENWYIRSEDDRSICIQIEVDFQKLDLDCVKDKAISYLNTMGKFYKYTYDIGNADNINDIVYIFEKWFYDEFLRYHREQLLNVVEFFNYYAAKNNSNEIKKELLNYFTTTLQKVDNQKEYLEGVSQEEILESKMHIDSNINSAAEELLTNAYDPKLDLICYLYNNQRNNNDAVSRLLRVVDNLADVDRRNLLEYVYNFYEGMNLENRLKVFGKLSEYYSEEETIDVLYRRIPNDEIYYGYLAETMNNAFWRN